LKNQLEDLSQEAQEISRYKEVLRHIKIIATPSSNVDESPLNVDLADTTIKEIRNGAENTRMLLSQLGTSFNSLYQELPLDSVDNHIHRTSLEDYSPAIENYKIAFSDLKHEQVKHNNEIKSHNALISNQIKELEDSKTLLSNYINVLNKDINSTQISNITEIKLHLVLSSDFINLLERLKKHNMVDNTLLDVSFYKSLSEFTGKYFNKKNKLLKLNDIITSINYQYKLDNSDVFITKGQSGGTTSAITALILSVLIKRITPKWVDLRVPIIVDEIGTFDDDNTEATVKQIAKHGFSIFCATPKFCPTLSQIVGNYIFIDKMKVENPIIENCCLYVLPEDIVKFRVKQ